MSIIHDALKKVQARLAEKNSMDAIEGYKKDNAHSLLRKILENFWENSGEIQILGIIVEMGKFWRKMYTKHRFT